MLIFRSKRNYNGPLFDAHCHLFNLDFLFKELKTILSFAAASREDEVREIIDTLSETESTSEPLPDLFQIIGWFFKVAGAAIGDEEHNFKTLQKGAEKAWNFSNLKATPLMMDLAFMFAPPLKKAGEKSSGYKQPGSLSVSLENQLENLKIPLKHRFNKKLKNNITEWIHTTETDQPVERGTYLDIVEFTPGFRHHFVKICELKKKYPENVFPFLAVDPRRKGIVHAAMDLNLVGPQGKFQGIKLYPRFGVHPQCSELTELYSHCALHSIPVVTHASPLGFPPGYDVYGDYGEPDNYRPILERHPGLRLNLAHLGANSGVTGNQKKKCQAWARQIISLMQDYNHVYSDLSCFTRKDMIRDYVNLSANFPILKERIMFGTDFDVMYLTNPGNITVPTYLRRFENKFSKELIEKMAGEIPRNFLGL